MYPCANKKKKKLACSFCCWTLKPFIQSVHYSTLSPPLSLILSLLFFLVLGFHQTGTDGPLQFHPRRPIGLSSLRLTWNPDTQFNYVSLPFSFFYFISLFPLLFVHVPVRAPLRPIDAPASLRLTNQPAVHRRTPTYSPFQDISTN